MAVGSIENADISLEHSSHLASRDGDSMQQIAAYFTEALADKLLKVSWPRLSIALNSTRILSPYEKNEVQKFFFDICPFLKVAYLITIEAILEAMNGEKMVHIIDLCSFEPAQWIHLLRTISARPEGAPLLRITGIHEDKEVLDKMALELTGEAEKLVIPFQFNPVLGKLENLNLESLGVRTGEVVVISVVLQLHTLLATHEELLTRNSPSVEKNLQTHFHMDQDTLREFLEKDPINVYVASVGKPPKCEFPKCEMEFVFAATYLATHPLQQSLWQQILTKYLLHRKKPSSCCVLSPLVSPIKRDHLLKIKSSSLR